MPLQYCLYKNSFGHRAEDRQTENDKHFPNYSVGGGRQKHQKPAFTGRRREPGTVCHPPPTKLRLYLLCFMMLWQPGRLLYRVPDYYTEHK